MPPDDRRGFPGSLTVGDGGRRRPSLGGQPTIPITVPLASWQITPDPLRDGSVSLEDLGSSVWDLDPISKLGFDPRDGVSVLGGDDSVGLEDFGFSDIGIRGIGGGRDWNKIIGGSGAWEDLFGDNTQAGTSAQPGGPSPKGDFEPAGGS